MLVRPAEDDDLAIVLGMAKVAKPTVGFLPDSAFRERAEKGTLLVAAEGGQPLGYVLYDLPRDEIKVIHLVVSPESQGHGVARALVDHVGERHRERRGIRLSCRNDFEAHSMWPTLGFTPMGERVGRSLNGRPLTLWWKSFGHPDLLTLLDEVDTRPTAVLDSCVFFDVIGDSPPPETEQLRSDWLGDHVRLAISSEVKVEISKGKMKALRDRQYSAAGVIPTVDPPEERWKAVCDAIRDVQPDAGASDESDLRQVSRAIAAGASWLVTTDAGLKSRYSGPAEVIGNLGVVSPSEFLRGVDEMARGEAYRPADLAGTEVSIREAGAEALKDLDLLFVNHADGETIRQLRDRIRTVASEPLRTQLQVVEVDGSPRALIAVTSNSSALHVPLVRVTGGRGAGVLARHLLGLLRAKAVESAADVVRIGDEHVSRPVVEQMPAEGYAQAGPGAYVAAVVRGVGSIAELHAEVDRLPLSATERRSIERTAPFLDSPASASQAESMFSPYRVLGAGLRTFLVPIKSAWAAPLFDVEMSNAQLFPRDWNLGLRRDLVYYRSPRNGGGIAGPCRVLWYVAGPEREYGTREIRAVSSVSEVVVRPPSHLWHRFERLGVYQRSDVEQAASEGVAMAIRFSNTELLRSPVSLDEYRLLATGEAKSASVVLQSPHQVDEHVFETVLKRGRGS